MPPSTPGILPQENPWRSNAKRPEVYVLPLDAAAAPAANAPTPAPAPATTTVAPAACLRNPLRDVPRPFSIFIPAFPCLPDRHKLLVSREQSQWRKWRRFVKTIAA